MKTSLLTTPQRALIAGFIAFVSGFFCKEVLRATSNIGDLFASLRMARDLLSGADPYAHPFGPDSVPYPLPAALAALPFSLLSDPLSTGVFIGVSSGALAWFVTGSGERWPLAIFLSWPFVYSVLYGQWTPLLTCLWFAPALLPLILIKPQTALPMVLTTRPSLWGIALTALVLGLSLALQPSWPWVWLGQISGYQGAVPPLFVLPIGPVLLLALLRWRERRAWLLALMALMPQRIVYDQLPLLLVASNWRESVFLVATSWLTLPGLLYFGGWKYLAGGWQLWIVATMYVPPLLVVLRSRANPTA